MKRYALLQRTGALLLAAALLLGQVPALAASPPQIIGTVTVTNPYYVNVRSGGGTSFGVIAQVQPGSVYPCVGIAQSGWYAILLDDGRTGYVANTLTSFTALPPAPATPAPPAYNQVQVPVYYRSSTGTLLYTDYVNLYSGSSLIRPSSAFVPGYRLLGPLEVTVSVSQTLVPAPRSVTFLYSQNAVVTATPRPSYSTVQVTYISPAGTVFYSGTAQVWTGSNYIQPDYSKVPSGYRVIGGGSVQVDVDSAGRATPGSVVFFFESGLPPVTTAPVTPKPVTPAPVPTPTPTPGLTGYLPEFVKTRPNSGSYPVFTGPGDSYYRVGRATLGGGTIRVYGKQGDWALIGYGLSNGGYRIGFVSLNAIPSNIAMQELSLSYIPVNNVSTSLFVDDPIVSNNRELAKNIQGGSPFYLLAYLNDFWAYVEIQNFENSGKPARGFVSRRSLGV